VFTFKSKKTVNNKKQRTLSNLLRVLYPVWMILAIISLMYIPSQLVVPGNPELTAQNIQSQEFLFRLGILGSLVTQILHIFIPWLLYLLFKQTSNRLSTLMLMLALISVPITMYNELHKMTSLMLFDDAEQLMLLLESNTQGLIIASIFWGIWLFPLGQLAIRSGFFPHAIGIIVIIAGAGYVLNSFTRILFPDFIFLITATEILTFGEIAFTLWFVVRGIRLP
jgi:membrane-bound metal-dependent hydrolase YbcI (DUF457 family)